MLCIKPGQTSQLCSHGYRSKSSCVKCSPVFLCVCGSGKHRRNCCLNNRFCKCGSGKQSSKCCTKAKFQPPEYGIVASQVCTQLPGRCACGEFKANECLKCRLNEKWTPILSSVLKKTDNANRVDTTSEINQVTKRQKTANDETVVIEDNTDATDATDATKERKPVLDQTSLPDFTFDVRGQAIQVPKYTRVFFLDPASTPDANLDVYDVRKCLFGVQQGTTVKFL